jgi:hypothetical protein
VSDYSDSPTTYQARAAKQVYSTARTVLPLWTTTFLLPEEEAEPGPQTKQEVKQQEEVEEDGAGLTSFDVLRGEDVVVKAIRAGFGVFRLVDGGLEVEELCGYTCPDEIVQIKVLCVRRTTLT